MREIFGIELVDRHPVLKRTLASPTYPRPSEFRGPWWGEQYSGEPPLNERWISAMRADKEVARVKFTFNRAPDSWAWHEPVPNGHIDIGAFEVASSERRTGVGRTVLKALRHAYPVPLMTAWTIDREPQEFWERVGWVRYQPDQMPWRESVAAAYVCPNDFV